MSILVVDVSVFPMRDGRRLVVVPDSGTQHIVDTSADVYRCIRHYVRQTYDVPEDTVVVVIRPTYHTRYFEPSGWFGGEPIETTPNLMTLADFDMKD